MTDFLTPVFTKKGNDVASVLQHVQKPNSGGAYEIRSAVAALEALRDQPSHATLNNIIRYLTTDGFSLLLPEPLNTSIAHQLVDDTLPNYWRVIKATSESSLLTQILQNPIGIGHMLTRLRTLVADSVQRRSSDEKRYTLEHIEDVIDALHQMLHDDQTSKLILHSVLANGKNADQRKLIWREYLAQIVSGRLLSLVAEAEDVLKSSPTPRTSSWLADGNKYAAWLGRNIAVLADDKDASDDYFAATVEFFSKALGLGYTDRIVASTLSILMKTNGIEHFSEVSCRMKTFEQRKYLNSAITFLIKQYLSSDAVSINVVPIISSKVISGAAGLISQIVKDDDSLREHLVTILTRSIIPVLDNSLAGRRSILAALSNDEEKLHTLLEKSIKLFGDSIYIKHTPVLHQEALAQTLALCSGYVHRSQPLFLTMMAKSSHHVNGMSNRIGATSTRARILGIVVGTGISAMVDKPELQLKFDLEGDEAEERRWYQQLMEVKDRVGVPAELLSETHAVVPAKTNLPKFRTAFKPSKTPTLQGPRVIEILSEDDDEDDDSDLLAYGKPDSDPEDDTDDPTAINRDKQTAPVYIRDLIAGLRDQENYDRHELALATAPSLIRRKANFGTEVTDHLEELATILTGLQDNSELTGFVQQRQQSLIALLLAKPVQMAQWFARSFFTGDYSLTQRITMLTTLGLGARELASMKDSSTEDKVPSQPSFPSKQLPAHLHKFYAAENDAMSVAKISSRMAQEMLSPIAARAADQLSGPNILKVRTFSSRMEVEKKRHKPIANALAKVVADNFFFPLTGRWWLQIRGSSESIYTSTHLLPPFLQTLSILLNASGPNTVALPQMTREYWDLLLSIRGLAGNDKNILGAVLFGFLMILETNENRERLATDQGRELMETQAWVKMVFERLGVGSEEDGRVRAMAAGVVVRCQEVVEKYQRRMAGALMDYQ